MFFNNKQRGLTILELLLVISLTAGIFLFSLNRYQQYKQNLAQESIKHDVNLIFQALSHYYHAENCPMVNGVPGVFPSVNQNLIPRLLAENYLMARDLTRAKPVIDYQALVRDTGLKTKDGKPVYEWQVIASFTHTINLEAYGHLLEAKAIDIDSFSLLWILPASANPVTANTPMWILNGSLARFKNQQAPQGDGCS